MLKRLNFCRWSNLFNKTSVCLVKSSYFGFAQYRYAVQESPPKCGDDDAMKNKCREQKTIFRLYDTRI